MEGLFSNLLATVLVAHSVLGCCWHHAHHDVCPGDEAGTRHSEAAKGCHGPGSINDHHRAHLCDEARCTFIRPSSDELSQAADAALHLTALPSLAGVVGAQLSTGVLPAPSAPLCFLPLRLHLAKHVLLI